MTNDFSKIMVNETRGRKIADLYMAAPDWDPTPETVASYDAFIAETARQYDAMIHSGLNVIFQDDDPYADAEEMFADAASGTLRVYRTRDGEDHPYHTNRQNDVFRAVHDYYGHFGSGRNFSRHGEEAAWTKHSRMYTPLARRAMTTETRGQNSAFIFALGGLTFPTQKFTLLPAWVADLA